MKMIECPRDAMQGIKKFIPTEVKVGYLQQLLGCGFDTLDLGSFVSPKAIPQMADTAEVINALDFSQTNTKALVIVANLRGAKQAVNYNKITYLGYPFSISENFQMRNTRKTIEDSLEVLQEVLGLSKVSQKKMVVYLSMGFGNPYGDPWSAEIVSDWVACLVDLGVEIISLSDTVGTACLEDIDTLLSYLIPKYPKVEFGVHLHTDAKTAYQKVDIAYKAGCRRFDSAIAGFGGCPMAVDELVGNMPTEVVLKYIRNNSIIVPNFSDTIFSQLYQSATSLFELYTVDK